MKNRLKNIRARLGYSQQEFAEKLGIEVNTYRGYEYKTKNLPNLLLEKIIIVFNVNVNYLFTGELPMFRIGSANSLKQIEYKTIDEDLKTFSERFDKILHINNLTTLEMSKITGISKKKLESFLNADEIPTLDDINRIKSKFDVNVEWLLYGDKNINYPTQHALNDTEITVLRKLLENTQYLFQK